MAENQVDKTDEPRPERKPYGPGVLMVLGLFLLGIAAYCFNDVVYPANAAAEWHQQGKHWSVTLNWVAMFAAALAAIYSFILAAVRSRKGAAGASADTEPPESDA